MNQQQEQLYNIPQQNLQKHNLIYGEENGHMRDFVVGTVVGGIIGAAAALLLAPKPGKDLRSDVAVQAVSLKDKGVNLSSTAKEKTVQISSQIKDQSTQFVDKVKAKTAKAPTVIDDGTVSVEGEEPIEETVAEEVSLEITEEFPSQQVFADDVNIEVSEVTKTAVEDTLAENQKPNQ